MDRFIKSILIGLVCVPFVGCSDDENEFQKNFSIGVATSGVFTSEIAEGQIGTDSPALTANWYRATVTVTNSNPSDAIVIQTMDVECTNSSSGGSANSSFFVEDQTYVFTLSSNGGTDSYDLYMGGLPGDVLRYNCEVSMQGWVASDTNFDVPTENFKKSETFSLSGS